MIQYLIIYKLKSFVRELKNPWKAFLTALLLFIAWMYGLFFGELSNKLSTREISIISSERFFNYLIIGLSGLTIIRMIFPNYHPLKRLFPQYYPISKGKRYLASLINDFQKPFFIYISIFILSGSYYLEISGFQFLITSSLVVINSQLIRRFLQYTIDFKTKSKSFIIHSLGPIIILFSFASIFLFNMDLPILLFTLMLALILIGYMQELSIESASFEDAISKSNKLNIIVKLLLNNKKARLPLIVGFILKSCVLLTDFFLFKAKGKHLFEGQILFWALASPLVIYTYVFNNIWGFWKNIWLNIEFRSGQYKSLIWLGFRLILIPLVLDIIITFPILWFSWWDDFKFILLFYSTITVYLLLLSFLWSLITPRKITTLFQMRGSTSPLSIIATMGGVFLLTTIRINHWFYILIPLFIIIGLIGLWLSMNMYQEKKYIIAKKIMEK